MIKPSKTKWLNSTHYQEIQETFWTGPDQTYDTQKENELW
jgi:hypothetical protein